MATKFDYFKKQKKNMTKPPRDVENGTIYGQQHVSDMLVCGKSFKLLTHSWFMHTK